MHNWSGWVLFGRVPAKKGIKVHGIKRRASSLNTDRINPLYQGPNIENRNLIPTSIICIREIASCYSSE